MTLGIVGRKAGMTRVFTPEGASIPVTVIECTPNRVTQVKTVETDGYRAVQVAVGEQKASRVGKALTGIYKKAGVAPGRGLWEIRLEDGEGADLQAGSEIKVNVFDGVKAVDVTGLTKGRGYSGAMKRHGFAGQRATHGVKKVHRHMGGTGALASNRGGGRMKKGKKMPGQYGVEQVTTRNIRVARLDKENHLLLVHGAVPGPNGGFVIVRETNKVT